ncbi:MAG TPA: dihydropteroate synthase [Pseudonocardiaceae bacterium]|nr:dihydropteroate synthase [Pseudonocardiaceae bacterium]
MSTFVSPDMGETIRTIGRKTFDFSQQVVIMGIINRTRDSFYDRGRTFEFGKALEATEEALRQGADWLDIGAVPFSPLAQEVDEKDELDRLLPLIQKIREKTDAVISVDTFRAEVARQAIDIGADAVNDTSALHDPLMAEVVADAGATLIIAHSKAAPGEWLARPHYTDVVSDVRDFLIERASFAESQGVSRDKIIIDPGHDLNKNTWHSLELTRRLGELATIGYPLLASVSNKDFIAETLGLPVGRLAEGTLATVVLCMLQGARIVRVHDVAAMRSGITVVEAVLGWRSPAVACHNVT